VIYSLYCHLGLLFLWVVAIVQRKADKALRRKQGNTEDEKTKSYIIIRD